MSKHRAEVNMANIIEETNAAFVERLKFPDRNGKHRAVESFNPMTGTTVTFKTEAGA